MINARAYMFVYMHVVYQSVSYKETDFFNICIPTKYNTTNTFMPEQLIIVS